MYPLCPTEAALVCIFSGAGSGVKVSKVGESYAAMVKKDPLEVGEAWIQIGGVGVDAFSKMESLHCCLVGRWDNFLDHTLFLPSLKAWAMFNW